MNFILTKHFYERLIQRNWNLNIVKEVINNPDKVENQEDWKIKYLKFDGEKYIHIVVAKNNNWTYTLITYYKTSKLKYLK